MDGQVQSIFCHTVFSLEMLTAFHYNCKKCFLHTIKEQKFARGHYEKKLQKHIILIQFFYSTISPAIDR